MRIFNKIIIIRSVQVGIEQRLRQATLVTPPVQLRDSFRDSIKSFLTAESRFSSVTFVSAQESHLSRASFWSVDVERHQSRDSWAIFRSELQEICDSTGNDPQELKRQLLDIADRIPLGPTSTVTEKFSWELANTAPADLSKSFIPDGDSTYSDEESDGKDTWSAWDPHHDFPAFREPPFDKLHHSDLMFENMSQMMAAWPEACFRQLTRTSNPFFEQASNPEQPNDLVFCLEKSRHVRATRWHGLSLRTRRYVEVSLLNSKALDMPDVCRPLLNIQIAGFAYDSYENPSYESENKNLNAFCQAGTLLLDALKEKGWLHRERQVMRSGKIAHRGLKDIALVAVQREKVLPEGKRSDNISVWIKCRVAIDDTAHEVAVKLLEVHRFLYPPGFVPY